MSKLENMLKYLIIGLLLVSSVSAAPSPYPIYGKVTLDGTPAHGMQIQLENLRTNEVLTIFTVGGEFVRDLSEFKISVRSDDDYEVRYCVADSRCSQETFMFMISGHKKDLSRDIKYIYKGLSTPYPVYGSLTLDGDLIPNAEIKLENLNKGYSKNLETNDLGEYNYNIANWGVYDIGDVIRLTYAEDQASFTSFTIQSFSEPGYELSLNIRTPKEDKDDKPDIVPEPEEEEIPEEEPGEEEEIVEPEPSPEPTKGNLWVLIVILIAILGGIGYLVYKKVYKKAS